MRLWLGSLDEVARFVTFYPAVLAAALLLGWKEATFVLVLSLSAAWYFFLPHGMSSLLAGWAFAGALNIAIIAALKTLAHQLAEANERQRLLFQELQHRVANTLQSAVGGLETVRRRMKLSPGEAASTLDVTIERMSASAYMHRRLHDTTLFNQPLEAMLREITGAVINQSWVNLKFNVEELDLTLDQKSVIAMLVIEVATNSAKHVFERNLGSSFEVALLALPSHRAVLRIKDDGPGVAESGLLGASKQKLGERILQGLVDQIHGALSIVVDQGREIVVDFPTLSRPSLPAGEVQFRPLAALASPSSGPTK
jgi:two-component sensor histidine kinase